jgi:hypothetical protein
LQQETQNYHYWLHNVLLDEAKREFRYAKAEKNAKLTAPVASEN